MSLNLIIVLALLFAAIGLVIVLFFRQSPQRMESQIAQLFSLLDERAKSSQSAQEVRFAEYQIQNIKYLQEGLQGGMAELRQQIASTLKQNNEAITQQVQQLNHTTEQHLNLIGQKVDKRLTEGFDKTATVFRDVTERLVLIDQAQKRITELSNNVVSLQDILSNRSARGAFGEVQLSALLRNMLPEQGFSLQHTLSNGSRPDCILWLPAPTGNIAIDAKFPLENYQRAYDTSLDTTTRAQAKRQFSVDVSKHVQAISTKYVVADETADGAIMFIPAEAVFAEIHAHYPDIIVMAQQARVWLASPTTMMAILTTVRAVLKDAATRKQVHAIQQHLIKLGDDFDRFQERMDKLAIHIRQANEDVGKIHISSKKLSNRFTQIEQVDLTEIEDKAWFATRDLLVMHATQGGVWIIQPLENY